MRDEQRKAKKKSNHRIAHYFSPFCDREANTLSITPYSSSFFEFFGGFLSSLDTVRYEFVVSAVFYGGEGPVGGIDEVGFASLGRVLEGRHW